MGLDFGAELTSSAGATNPAHILDTDRDHTADSLLSVREDGSEVWSVRHDGAAVPTRHLETVVVTGDDTSRTTRATAVQSAVTDAENDGKPFVFVPDNFLNFASSAIGASTAVQLIREGQIASWYDVKAYGAAGGGSTTTSDAQAVKLLVNSMPDQGGTCYFPPGRYVMSTDIVIPSIGTEFSRDVVKPVHFLGESVGRNTEFFGAVEEGVSVINGKQPGNLFDCRLGTDANTHFTGGFENLVMIGEGTTGTKAIYMDFVTNRATLKNLGIRSFGENIHVAGDAFYLTLDRVHSERAQNINLLIEGKTNGLNVVEGNYMRAQTDNVKLTQTAPGGASFFGTWIQNAGESGSGIGIHVTSGSGPIAVYGGYFESNYQDCVIDGQGGNFPTLSIADSFFALEDNTGSGDAPVEVRHHAKLDGNVVRWTSTDNHGGFVDRIANTNPTVIAIGNKKATTTSKKVPLLASALSVFDQVTALHDELAADTTDIGAPHVVKTVDGDPFEVKAEGTDAAILAANSAAGTFREMQYRTGGVRRWAARANSAAESGSEAGSNYEITAYDDSGVKIDIPVTIARAAGGAMTVRRPLEMDDDLDHDGSKVGFFGVSPSSQTVDSAFSNTPNSGSTDTDALITALKNAVVDHGLGST